MISATLTITINDLNDNPPEFTRIEQMSFKENLEEDQLVGIVVATDPDGKGHNEVSYYLQYVNLITGFSAVCCPTETPCSLLSY
jgi:hypothetical protein